MSYIINVAKRATDREGPSHVFRTSRTSIFTKAHAVEVCRQLALAYPEPKYEVSLSYEFTHGEYICWRDGDPLP